ncbi:hypothetical protein KDW_60930 [Dictyobacter vulcani]|uniref:HTH marR-type domain-containing protein n=1 Tax=Dictyobacter vulcani TaxID=2607529 RepID=A0A5J4KZM5_9CHLR|nr:MarR family transcriptional regulator [Dictyobacter vulcani]GER91931.1 hypothetical protein KDW_60930 [Dictyobacter vulcani]
MDSNSGTAADTVRMLCTTVMKTARQELMQRLEDAEIGLSPHQFLVLRRISDRAMALNEVSRDLGLDPSTLAPTVELLVRRGLVQRERDPLDRRRTPLSLTPEGSETLERLMRTSGESPLNKSLSAMGPEKSQQLVALLQEFVTSLGHDARDEAMGHCGPSALEKQS